MARLVAIRYSPWSEKARWALDHHRVPYEYEEYLPMLGEPILRWRLGRPVGRVGAPAFFDGDRWIDESFDIARRAERLGGEAPLFPADRLETVARWNLRSDSALAAGRALTLKVMADSPEALEEALPGFIPAPARPRLQGVARLAVQYLRSKYSSDKIAAAEQTLIGELEELRAALQGTRETILDGFSFADIAMAVALQGVKPVGDDFIPLGRATRQVWTNPELAERFADLCDWRDRLYAKYRRR